MPPATDAGNADVLNSIVTITDLLSHKHTNEGDDSPPTSPDILAKLIEAIARLKGVLVSKDDAIPSFLDSGGFESLLKTLETAAHLETSPHTSDTEDQPDNIDVRGESSETFQLRKELLQLSFAALSQVLASSDDAKAVFARIDGYTQILATIRASDCLQHVSRRDCIFGNLISAAINDFTHCHIFSSMRWHLAADDLTQEEKLQRIALKIRAALETTEQLPNPECLGVAIELLADIVKDQDLGIAVCDALQIIVDARRANQLSFFTSKAHADLIGRVILESSTWATEFLSVEEDEILEDLVFSLSPLGLPLGLTTTVVSNAVQRTGNPQEPSLLDVLQQFALQSRLPPHFHFDMHPNGFAALTFPALQGQFPPSSSGYTVSCWFRIEKFDSDMHLTLFGAYDVSQKCFAMLYIEQDTHKLVLQTSLRSSVRFKLVEFSTGRWYHFALAHKRPRTTSSARALLYVDGVLVDQVKCSYPSPPPTTKAPVQAFFGTPPSFATPSTIPSLQWSLSQGHVWGEILPEDLLEIIYHLGPRYHGNFQDSLGQFQTYEASTALNIRLGSMGGAKAEKSVLMAAVRGKGGTWAPESKLLLSVSPLALAPCASGDDGPRPHVLNCAVPRIADAVALQTCVGGMIGSPVVVIPKSLDDAIWCLGGSAIGLRMVEKAANPDELLLSVRVLFELVRLNWRNSEDMERCHGYEILAFLLKGKKREFITAEVLGCVGEFIGFDVEDPRESQVANPLAFRYLLLDFGLWKRGSVETQVAHLQMLLSLVEQSRHRVFNLRRLNKMRTVPLAEMRLTRGDIVKKMLFALRSGMFSKDVLPTFITTLKVIIKANFSTEVVRSLATFVTSTSHKGWNLFSCV
jgi:beige protein homolog 1